MADDFEQEQAALRQEAEDQARLFREDVDEFARMYAHGLGRRYFWDEPPAVRWANYILNPPQLPDGSIPPPGEGGEWNYGWLAERMPWVYEQFLEDFARSMQAGLKAAQSL